eukprot:CAMPEP_0185775798 /NCGR_PEP_ID=MMETSP1174-20130828/83321_1 /TAXON_ID=35687 /ORGANISM="Dictyocha speculum, Strain CCMP1381" /LENGTH=132 /DNA_ID=CAMNT_0028463485 /DNA_START=427 /DNA_END=821 /DNA_ORIENTATION=+
MPPSKSQRFLWCDVGWKSPGTPMDALTARGRSPDVSTSVRKEYALQAVHAKGMDRSSNRGTIPRVASSRSTLFPRKIPNPKAGSRISCLRLPTVVDHCLRFAAREVLATSPSRMPPVSSIIVPEAIMAPQFA